MRILRPKQVAQKLEISVATLYRIARRPGFPERVQLGPRSTGWIEGEIEQWLSKNRIRPGSREKA